MGTVRYTVIDGEVVSELRGGVKRDYVPDPLGSTVALLDNTQTKTDAFEYWPYGESAARTGTTATPFQFVGSFGYYRDRLAQSYVRTRYLNLTYGNWITEDTIGIIDDSNLYRYVLNRVITLADPIGTQPPLRGNYCGPQSPPSKEKPIDDLDRCCKQHDDCWNRHHCNAMTGWLCPLPICRECNRRLCDCVIDIECSFWDWKCLNIMLFILKNWCPDGGPEPSVPYPPEYGWPPPKKFKQPPKKIRR